MVGEALVDVVRARGGSVVEHAGGSSANAAVALSRLGREVWFATALGDDVRGRLLADHLAANEVHLAVDPLVLDRTATAVATLGEDGSASYSFDMEWLLPQVTLPAEVTPGVVVFGSLGASLQPGAGEVARLVDSWRGRALTVLDLNVRPAVTGAGPAVVEQAERMIGLADGVKASDEDLDALWPGRDHRDVAAAFLAAGSGAVVVTQGARGASWFAPGSAGAVAAPQARVIDTIGAGDTMTAGVVDGLWRAGVTGPGATERLQGLGPARWQEVLEFGVRAAAVTVSRPGADPPRRDELD